MDQQAVKELLLAVIRVKGHKKNGKGIYRMTTVEKNKMFDSSLYEIANKLGVPELDLTTQE